LLSQVIAEYHDAIVDTDQEKALRVVQDAVRGGVSPEDIVFKVVLPSMDQMMKSISESKEMSLAQHFVSARIADMVTAEMIAKFQTAPEVKGRVVIGNSYGDMHSLGRRIVIGCLKARFIEVIDVGTNVKPETFVEAAVAHDAAIIGISSMMVHTARGENGCLGVRKILKERDLEGRIKLVVGGAPYRFDHDLWKKVGADAWAMDAITAGKVIEDLIEEVRK